MKKVYGYIRVSTVDQEDGASLDAQRDSIQNYAAKNDLQVIEWFEEVKTAAKIGRPVFSRVMELLKQKKAEGLIVHKIDRSARNLRDWADLGDLIDLGIDVHFSFESIDFSTRGGRLSADIQAVIASDHIRVVRSETKKGLYGRLNQGIYPFDAPIGYLNTGGGNLKAIDPVKAPLIKKLFELYATGLYSVIEMGPIMFDLGLTNRNGKRVTRNGISHILHNQFYIGIIKLRKNGMVFAGGHQPLISKELFDSVQKIMAQKSQKIKTVHDFQFRKCIKCGLCNRSLIAEKQKGHVYYRCHIKGCPTKTVREEVIENCLLEFYNSISISAQHEKQAERVFGKNLSADEEQRNVVKKSVALDQSKLASRMSVLNDKLMDQLIDDQTYAELKEKLLHQEKQLSEKLEKMENDKADRESEIKFLELLKSLKNMYVSADMDSKRRMVKLTTSNLSYINGKICIQTSSALYALSNSHEFEFCAQIRAPSRNKTQTPKAIPNKSTVTYSVTTLKPGEFKITRDNKTSISVKTDNGENKDEDIHLNQCHDVMVQLESLYSTCQIGHDIAA